MKRACYCILFIASCFTGRAQSALFSKYVHTDGNPVAIQKVTPIPASFTYMGNKVPRPVPGDFYTKNFGFFCRQELKMHQAHVPVSFRLGSMEYCDMMEQKGCSAH